MVLGSFGRLGFCVMCGCLDKGMGLLFFLSISVVELVNLCVWKLLI